MSLLQFQLLLPLLPGAMLYLYLVKRLRFSRADSMPSILGYTDRASFSRMSIQDAWQIHNYLVELEFPTTFSAATMFALFKAYGIPSISSLLCATGQFSSKDTVDKRYTDTGCLLLEAVLNPPASPRAVDAIARINYLHSAHRASGKITDSDMLYTLSLFALEPSRWVARYEWRCLTGLERCALGTLWKQLGEALGVSFDLLPGSQAGWKDGVEWLDQLDSWSREYQDTHMVPASSNKKVADATLYHILWKVPNRFKPMGKKIVAAILEKKLREAMMIPRPPPRYITFIHRLNSFRKFFLLHLALPRWKPKKRLPIASESGRLYARKYNIQPWYVKPTIMNRWGLAAWRTWFKGGVLPGDQEDKYFPTGFVASELGPTRLRKCGGEEMDVEKQRLKSESTLNANKCPFLAQQ